MRGAGRVQDVGQAANDRGKVRRDGCLELLVQRQDSAGLYGRSGRGTGKAVKKRADILVVVDEERRGH